jgi:hypothetical protein
LKNYLIIFVCICCFISGCTILNNKEKEINDGIAVYYYNNVAYTSRNEIVKQVGNVIGELKDQNVKVYSIPGVDESKEIAIKNSKGNYIKLIVSPKKG